MRFWCFNFEGFFADDSPEYPGQGVFSGCLVKADNYNDAEFAFLKALSERKINLLEIEEDFPVDTDQNEMDLEAEDNLFWIEWCEEVEMTGKPSFQTFNLYPANEVIKPNKKDS
ncbi:MAG: hypothetical protein M3384_05815 [Acidobacteriota bacterium]|nr:hypothetical protein [Acidobacteriota bacterium]